MEALWMLQEREVTASLIYLQIGRGKSLNALNLPIYWCPDIVVSGHHEHRDRWASLGSEKCDFISRRASPSASRTLKSVVSCSIGGALMYFV
jgi:hypothetical protein